MCNLKLSNPEKNIIELLYGEYEGENQSVIAELINYSAFSAEGEEYEKRYYSDENIYIVSGHTPTMLLNEDGSARMVQTPWYAEEIPFNEAASMGTKKVIENHSNIGIVLTSDGSFGEFKRYEYEMIEEKTATIVGLDGRKMSKSYGNQLPLFADEAALKKLIAGIKTDSSLPTEPKPLDSTIFEYIKVFGTEEQIKTMEQKFNTGISWAEAKQSLFEIMNSYLSPMREKYNYYMENFDEVLQLLEKGERQARKIAKETIDRVRKAVGVI